MSKKNKKTCMVPINPYKDTKFALFTQFLHVVNQIAPIKTTKVKNHTQDWFGQEIKEKIALRDRFTKIW